MVSAESAMLARHGHRVEELLFDNEAIQSGPTQVCAALSSFFSLPAYTRASRLLERFQPDVLHVHNFLPRLSPSIFFAGQRARTPVVQTLHNYRVVCANALLFRDGKVCEECLDTGSFLPGIKNACYRGSRIGGAVVGGSMALHAKVGTWSQRVERYIVLTEFAASKLSSRLPPQRIRVKPNFVPDCGTGDGTGDYLLFVGRLSEEKGLRTLLAADRLGQLPFPVLIIGDGPLQGVVEETCARPGSRLKLVGCQSADQVLQWMKHAGALLVPSACYEGFPMTIVEAFSVGLPVIASRIGGLPEIVDRHCGMLHEASDPKSLFDTIQAFSRVEPAEILGMRRSARARYLQRYSEPGNYAQLMGIYAEAIRGKASPGVTRAAPSIQERQFVEAR